MLRQLTNNLPRAERPAQPQRGQALVEMAMVVILLLTLAVATVDFGVYMYRFVQAGNCARETARRAAVRDPNAGAGDESDYCIDNAVAGALSLPSGYCNLPPGEPVTATLNTNHQWLALDGLVSLLTAGTVSLPAAPISASSTMRMEGQVAGGGSC